jgi:hypothetical protein
LVGDWFLIPPILSNSKVYLSASCINFSIIAAAWCAVPLLNRYNRVTGPG